MEKEIIPNGVAIVQCMFYTAVIASVIATAAVFWLVWKTDQEMKKYSKKG
ncbi:hypothetical protein JMG10_07765 [Nostoc ellipsosporum NOK]|nr:hypothetical protein [Nostoc ellipsosporum NOK]